MAFEIRFLPEYDLIFVQYSGIMTLDEVREGNRQFVEALNQAESAVTVLVDLRSVVRFPTSLNQIRRVLQVTRNPKIRWMVLVVNDNPLMKRIVPMIVEVTLRGVRFRLFESSLEALRFIELLDGQSRSTIPVDPALMKLMG